LVLKCEKIKKKAHKYSKNGTKDRTQQNIQSRQPKGADTMKKLRKIFEGGEGRKNREAESAAFVALGLMWMMLDGMMAIGLLFMVIGIVDMEKGRERKKEDSLRKKTKRQNDSGRQKNEKDR
jgi:hypothetical protein